MDFSAWCAAKGIALDGLDDKVKQQLQAAWRAEQKPADPPKKTDPNSNTNAGQGKDPTAFEAGVRAAELESERIEYLETRTLQAVKDQVGNPAKIKQLRELCDSAKADPKVDKRDFDLALLRLDRTRGPLVFAPTKPQVNAEVIEAAVCMTTRLPNVEKQYSEQTLQAAHTNFRRGIGLKELLVAAAEQNSGYRGSARDEVALCRAAFRNKNAGDWQADGISTIDVPGILSNVGNKFLAAGFLFSEQAWRAIAKIRNANDFKTMTTYRLAGNAKFQKIAPTGEIKHGTLEELPYTNKVDQYGLMLGISRPDIRNDDLGAFTQNGQELGRGAGTSLNEIFWAVLQDDAAFFTSGHNNLIENTALAVLNEAGYENLRTKFKTQTKKDGTPLGVEPRILLCSTGLEVTAMRLMNSPFRVGGGNATAFEGSTNVLAGMTRVVSSAYLHAVLATLWYLLADPNDVPVIEVAFLDGKDTPTIETGEFDFDRLGLAMRGYMDWGCALQEYRGGQKSNGEAS